MTPMSEPMSKLTLERPDIWIRALGIATKITGYQYPHKAPLPDGTIMACGGGYSNPNPYKPQTPEEEKKRKIEELERSIKYDEGLRETYKNDIIDRQKRINDLDQIIQEKKEKLEKLKRTGMDVSSVFVPEGAMEWLLHEAGHWLAATPEERRLPNYGYGSLLCLDDSVLTGTGAEREWEAWAFEEIILAPFGASRSFVAPEHGGGVAFSKSGPIPDLAMRRIEKQIHAERIDIEQWRSVYGEWAKWIH